MQILIGTSGWMYKHWNKKFFPKEITGTAMLPYFARFFKTVEINSSFYRVPEERVFKAWYRNTPRDFLFSVKLNRFFTHRKKLILDDDSLPALREFLRNARCLKEKYAALLIQLPPGFAMNTERLDNFLSTLRKLEARTKYRPDIAIEFRHSSWFDPEIYDLLKVRNTALVVAQSEPYPERRIETADFSYIRFHGPGRMFASSYSTQQLDQWAQFIKSRRLRRIYAYFNNDFEAFAIENASYLKKVLK